MDWTLAIERNSTALKRIVATLAAMAGLDASTSPLRGEVAPQRGEGGGGDAAHPTPDLRSDPPPRGEGGAFRLTLPRRLHRAMLRLLRPAESAVRRLIIIAARGLVVLPSPLRDRKPAPPSIFVRNRRGTGIILPRGVLPKSPRPAPRFISLPLSDPLKRPFRRHRPTPICEPRISYPGPFNRLSPIKIRRSPPPDDRLDATRLTLRINALAAALDDLPAQARRLARWQANRARDKERDAAVSEAERGFRATSQSRARSRFRRLSPLRPGRPPGSLRRPDHDVHDLLTELHGLAFDVLEHLDTS